MSGRTSAPKPLGFALLLTLSLAVCACARESSESGDADSALDSTVDAPEGDVLRVDRADDMPNTDLPTTDMPPEDVTTDVLGTDTVEPDVPSGDGSTTDEPEVDDDGHDAIARDMTLREPAVHRPVPVECDDVRRDFEPTSPGCGEDMARCCETHDDCTAGANGRCIGNSHDGWYCSYDMCRRDDECGDYVCECEGGFRGDHNVCLRQGNCVTDADCGENGYCSPSFGECGGYSGVVGYFCHTREDECIDDADCGADRPGSYSPPYCVYNPSVGHWMCSESLCAG